MWGPFHLTHHHGKISKKMFWCKCELMRNIYFIKVVCNVHVHMCARRIAFSISSSMHSHSPSYCHMSFMLFKVSWNNLAFTWLIYSVSVLTVSYILVCQFLITSHTLMAKMHVNIEIFPAQKCGISHKSHGYWTSPSDD
jgi:hypothetical protein